MSSSRAVPSHTVPAAVEPASSDYLTPEERREREEIKAKVKHLVAYQQISRNLRAKLQYAAFKVRHNVAHLTFEELEALVLVPDPGAQVRAFAAAATAANPTDNGRTALSATISGDAQIPRSQQRLGSAAEGSNAMQSLYAYVLAQPPSTRARTIYTHNSDSLALPAPARLPLMGPSRSREGYRGAGAEHGGEGESASTTASLRPSLKRKATASTSRSKTSKRKRCDSTALASCDDDQDVKAAAMLHGLFRNSRPSFPTHPMHAQHILEQSDAESSHPSFGYKERRFRTQRGMSPLIQSATAALVHNNLGTSTTVRSDTAPLLCTDMFAGPSSSLAAMGGTPAGTGDKEAVALLYHLHGGPAHSSPFASTGCVHGTAASRTLPPHARKLAQESTSVVEPQALPMPDAEMHATEAIELPVIRVTPPTPTAPVLALREN